MNLRALARTASFFAISLLGAPSVAFGVGLPDKIVTCNGLNCTVCDIALTAQNILNTFIYVSVFLSAVLFAWAGFRYVSAGGSDSQAKSAKETFWNVSVGLVIILASWLIVDTLMRTLTGAPIGPWNKICEAFMQAAHMA